MTTKHLIIYKAENHMTYFDYFVLVFGQNGEENCSVLPKYSTNFHTVKYKYLVFVSRKRLLRCFMLCAVVFCTTSSKDFQSLLEVE